MLSWPVSPDARPLALSSCGAATHNRKPVFSETRSTPHLVLCAPHPSPLSAYRGFFGSRPFSKTMRFWKQTGESRSTGRRRDWQTALRRQPDQRPRWTDKQPSACSWLGRRCCYSRVRHCSDVVARQGIPPRLFGGDLKGDGTGCWGELPAFRYKQAGHAALRPTGSLLLASSLLALSACAAPLALEPPQPTVSVPAAWQQADPAPLTID